MKYVKIPLFKRKTRFATGLVTAAVLVLSLEVHAFGISAKESRALLKNQLLGALRGLPEELRVGIDYSPVYKNDTNKIEEDFSLPATSRKQEDSGLLIEQATSLPLLTRRVNVLMHWWTGLEGSADNQVSYAALVSTELATLSAQNNLLFKRIGWRELTSSCGGIDYGFRSSDKPKKICGSREAVFKTPESIAGINFGTGPPRQLDTA